ncbi:MAG: hypothetical protein VKL59_00605 [Nostocaceae cyanobacterium]|nr:hypothetical protein [Nostocaceae cyanobacterium]
MKRYVGEAKSGVDVPPALLPLCYLRVRHHFQGFGAKREARNAPYNT